MQIKVATSGFRAVDLPPAVAQDLVAAIETTVCTAPAQSARMRMAPDLTFSVRLADGEHVYELLAGGTVLRDPVTRHVWQFEAGRAVLQGLPRPGRQQPARAPRVFISYSIANREWGRAFAEALKKYGMRVWFDELETTLGDSMDALASTLRTRVLEESDVLVTVVEKDMLSMSSLFFELGVALGTGKRLVAIVPKELDPSALPIELRRRRYLLRDSPQETAEELSRALAAA